MPPTTPCAFGLMSLSFLGLLAWGAPACAAPGLALELGQAIGDEHGQMMRLNLSGGFGELWKRPEDSRWQPLWEASVGHWAPEGELTDFSGVGEVSLRLVLLVHVGPERRLFLEVGTGVSHINRRTVPEARDDHRDLDLGNHLLGRSHIGIGAWLDQGHRWSLVYRLEHLSNGGLDQINPGINWQSLQLGYRF